MPLNNATALLNHRITLTLMGDTREVYIPAVSWLRGVENG